MVHNSSISAVRTCVVIMDPLVSTIPMSGSLPACLFACCVCLLYLCAFISSGLLPLFHFSQSVDPCIHPSGHFSIQSICYTYALQRFVSTVTSVSFRIPLSPSVHGGHLSPGGWCLRLSGFLWPPFFFFRSHPWHEKHRFRRHQHCHHYHGCPLHRKTVNVLLLFIFSYHLLVLLFRCVEAVVVGVFVARVPLGDRFVGWPPLFEAEFRAGESGTMRQCNETQYNLTQLTKFLLQNNKARFFSKESNEI